MPCLNKNLSSFSYYNALLKTVNIFELNKKRLYSTRLNPALIQNVTGQIIIHVLPWNVCLINRLKL